MSGTWKDLTDSVNSMAGNLTSQVRNIAAVTTAVAKGDLTKKITVDVQGEILELKNTVNTMVDQLSSFAAEVTRVAREVGTEGKLGGQAEVPGVDGTWKDLTDNVNLMASNLTVQLRDVSKVATAIATGDLTQKVTVDVRGEILQIKNVTNTMVDQLRSFASEVTRVAREVGTEGKLGGQARVEGVSGTWKDLTDSVNSMAGNLTSQVRNIAAVTTAVARGDLSKQITVDVQGEILELKNTVNTMVDQLSSFAAEVTRVAREVGSEGKLGGQADVRGVAGTWKDLTDSVNFMAGNLTSQVRNIAEVTTAVAKGDLTKKITVDVQGEILELKNTVNTMVDQLSSFAAEVTRVAREVGTEGALGGQAEVPGVDGTWKDLTDNVNLMASNLTVQLRDVSKVATAIATGDLTQKVTVDVRGEILQIKNVINTMVDQLRSFAAEVTRVAREVGTEGKLGGQAQVQGVAGTWKDLTDNVNLMAGNLTSQVRGIARVVTAVAGGDLTRKLTVEAEGEIAALSDTINGMIETLATFADQVTSVAFEVGVEGKLGGQASVPGAAGTWKDLTDNVNRLAANLTTQVRAIAEVATAVTTGDLTRSIQVEAQGEVAALKDNINYMIGNLKDTTLKNAEQDWLKTNLAKFSRMLQGQRDLLTVGRLVLSELAPVVSAQQGVLYVLDSSEQDGILRLLAGYAHKTQAAFGETLRLGEGLIGQCAMDRRKIQLDRVPAEYFKVVSGLGEATPQHVVILPILFRRAGERASSSWPRSTSSTRAPCLPRPAHRKHRHRPAHHRGQHAHGRPAEAVAVAGAGAAVPAAGAAADQPAARREGQAAGRTERRSGAQEHRGRAGAAGAGGKGQAAGADLALQVRVPRQHVARAAHAAQQPADPLRPALEEPGGQPHGQAGAVRADDPRVGQRPADADQRHPRSVEDRIGHRGGGHRGLQPRAAAPLRRPHVPPRRRSAAAGLLDRHRAAAVEDVRDRSEAAAAGAEEPALERLQVHRARVGAAVNRQRPQRMEPGPRRARPRPVGTGDLGSRYRHRHPAREAADHLRGLPAGRRQHEPQVRRHRARTGDQPRAGAAAGRRAHAGEHARSGQHVHALPAPDLLEVARRANPAPRRSSRGGPAAWRRSRSTNLSRRCARCRRRWWTTATWSARRIACCWSWTTTRPSRA